MFFGPNCTMAMYEGKPQQHMWGRSYGTAAAIVGAAAVFFLTPLMPLYYYIVCAKYQCELSAPLWEILGGRSIVEFFMYVELNNVRLLSNVGPNLLGPRGRLFTFSLVGRFSTHCSTCICPGRKELDKTLQLVRYSDHNSANS